MKLKMYFPSSFVVNVASLVRQYKLALPMVGLARLNTSTLTKQGNDLSFLLFALRECMCSCFNAFEFVARPVKSTTSRRLFGPAFKLVPLVAEADADVSVAIVLWLYFLDFWQTSTFPTSVAKSTMGKTRHHFINDFPCNVLEMLFL